MRVLDLDLDYFLDMPVHDVDYSSNKRVVDSECIKSVWSEERVRAFLENNLGLSKKHKVEGHLLKGHDEALYFWGDLLEAKKLVAPFSVVHVDSHADLSFGDITKDFVLNDLIFWKPEYRIPRYCKDCEFDGRYYNIGIGNYLLYALAFRWISDLSYCANPNCDAGDIPKEILTKRIPECLTEPYSLHIKLCPTDECCTSKKPQEPKIPLQIISKIEQVQNDKQFDFISVAQSPNYTPKNADYILDIVKEYIVEV